MRRRKRDSRRRTWAGVSEQLEPRLLLSGIGLALGAPVAMPPAPDLAPESDTGVANADNITTVVAPTFIGALAAVDPAATVEVFVDGVSCGTTTANADGSWQFTVPANTPLAEGTRHITITATVDVDVSDVSPELVIVIDRTAPVLVWGAASPAPNAAGWNNTDVRLPFAPSDDVALAPGSPAGPVLLTTEGAGITATVVLSDCAGNTATFTTAAFNIDKTAPALVWGQLSPQPNLAGWNDSDVAIPYTLTEISGIVGGSPANPVMFTAEGTGQSRTLVLVDLAGNTASYTTATINIDKTAPTLVWGGSSPVPNAAGWFNTDVSVSFTAADALSGMDVASTADPLVISAEGRDVSGLVFLQDVAGNTRTFTSTTFNIDKTGPTILWGTPAPLPNAAGWNNTDVTMPFTASDAISGLAGGNSSSSVLLSAEGPTVIDTIVLTDIAGNSVNYQTPLVKIDKTAPSLAWGAATPQPNALGWNNTDVQVPFTADDAMSGLAQATPQSPLVVWTEGSAVSRTILLIDEAGNSASFTTPSFKIDKTMPQVIWGAAWPQPNAAGWNNTSVSVPFTASDSFSGMAAGNPTGPIVVTMEGNGVTVSMAVFDQAGNTALVHTPPLKIDMSAPWISVQRQTPAQPNGWNVADVVVNYVAHDPLSGMASGESSGTYTITSEGTGLGHAFTVTDQAGNSSTASIGGIRIDKTPPTLTWGEASPAANPAGWRRENVSVPFTAGDAVSGVAPGGATGSVLLDDEGAAVTGEVVIRDMAGNAATFTTPAFMIDKSAPRVIWGMPLPSPNAAGWNNSDVSIPFIPGDTLSGLVPQSPSGPVIISGEGVGLTGSIILTDLAGNTVTFHTPAFKIDRTAPIIAAHRDTPAKPNGWNTGSVSCGYIAVDGLSGMPAGMGEGSYVFRSEGYGQLHTFSVTDVAGNPASAAIDGVNIHKSPPTATVKAGDIRAAGASQYAFTVTYRDDRLVNAATVGKGDVYVKGPRRFVASAALVSRRAGANGSVVAVYRIIPPGGVWDAADNGVYAIYLNDRHVSDVPGNFMAAGRIAMFTVNAFVRQRIAKSPPSTAAVPATVAAPVFWSQSPIREQPRAVWA